MFSPTDRAILVVTVPSRADVLCGMFAIHIMRAWIFACHYVYACVSVLDCTGLYAENCKYLPENLYSSFIKPVRVKRFRLAS